MAQARNRLSSKLTTTAISKPNVEVTGQKEQPAAVAEAWLEPQHLIWPPGSARATGRR
ncbi:MAG: hypothetical protein ACYCU7_17045 [Acidimicrobiales bacterium]